ncbi:hypothetical protein ACSBR2_016049 [Camellia fascicularis]
MERKRMIPVVVVVLSSNSGITPLIPLVFTLLLVIPHSFIMAQPAPTYLHSNCTNTGNYTRGSQFDSNLQLLDRTVYNNGSDNKFSSGTEGNDPDKVYGLFLCRGDVQPSICKNCVKVAGVTILGQCPLYKEAIIWYDECLIRYSSRSFFSTMETYPTFDMFNSESETQPDKLYENLEKTFSNLSIVATSNPLNHMYATSSINKLYSMVQCTPDLSPTDCRSCLNITVSELLHNLDGRMGGRVFSPSCNVRFEYYCFWLDSSAPTYLHSTCINTGNYTTGSQFGINLQHLLLQNFNGSDNNFYNGTKGDDPDKVYGLFLCRGDVQPSICQKCIGEASDEIVRHCPLFKEAIIWYDECLISYSNRSLFSNMETSPSFCMLNPENATQPDKLYEILEKTFSNLSSVATSNPSNHMYATNRTNVTSSTTLYSMVQCTPDLSPTDCRICLNVAVSELLSQLNGKKGGRVLSPSCNIRFELYPFTLDPSDTAQPPAAEPAAPQAPAPNRTKSDGGGGDSIAVAGSRGNNGGMKGKIITISIITSLSLFLVVTLLGSCIYYQKRRKRTHVQKDDGNSSEVELLDLDGGRFGNNYNSENLQADFPSFQLDIVFAATEHFSAKNKLGEGGFGPVYKGTLPDGREIAVKRLSKTSGQGLKELKNEVILIARLQHRNLVRLLGCCLEENESLLIYEYMPNKSLDVFLFDSTRGELLDWKRRFLIINGIARGILYLHEDSRLRIIHRDLKASNVLLDHEMNPKISDFGMARIFGGNQNEANTRRIVGSYGYMAPEYAMEGLFSVKSDVFSFGVILLEIISGKKNSGFHLFKHGHSLLTFSCVVNEVLKCIHIGLLCVQEDAADRPTMSFVVVMLGSDAVILPQPKQPAFSVGRQVLELAECSQNLNIHSVNEITISDVSPR